MVVACEIQRCASEVAGAVFEGMSARRMGVDQRRCCPRRAKDVRCSRHIALVPASCIAPLAVGLLVSPRVREEVPHLK